MNQKAFREILIFVAGTTPQIVTETLYGLTQECQSPIFPDEIHIITTSSGKQKIEGIGGKSPVDSWLRFCYLKSMSRSLRIAYEGAWHHVLECSERIA